MSEILRIEMFITALLFLVFVIRAINKNYFLLKNAFGWLVLATGLLFMAILPNSLLFLADFLGFKEASNFLYFSAIMILLINAISNSVLFSKQQIQIKDLIQEISLMKSKENEGE